jgi:hypothetical protein
MLLLGAAIIMASIVWELARMNPATPYLVEPWSLRGYESVHGSVTFTIGALLFLAGLLTIWERSKEPTISRIVAIMMGAGAIGIAAIYGTDEKTMGGGFLGWVIAVLAGYVAQAAIVPLLPKMSRVAHLGISALILVVTATVLSATLLGTSRSALPVVWVTIAALVLVGIAITGVPAELAANRMLIFSTVGGGAAIALSAAASRSNLIAAQLELDGVAGKFQDTQVTSGWFVALFGILVAFVGAVSLWAKRRDIIINQQRAERQRAAAEASAAEIQAALELAQEHQRASRSAPQQG